MALNSYCGKDCCSCDNECLLSQTIPCSPSCKNLTEDRKIKIKNCLEDGCITVKYIFDMARETDNEIIKEYGEIAEYPYYV